MTPIYGLLGLSASLAFESGARLRPMEAKAALVNPTRHGLVEDDAVSGTGAAPPSSTGGGAAVVIPALIRTEAERETLQACVAAIAGDKAVQAIFVIDDGSPSPLSLVGCTVVHHTLNCGPAAARNTGMRLALEAGAETIVFTDADCSPTTGWASAHAALQKTSPGVWAGHTVAAGSGVVSRFHDAIGTLMPRVFLGRGDEALYGPTCNLSISKDVAKSVAFDSTFPTFAFEDCDFCVRAHAAGFAVRASDRPLVKHHFDERVSGLLTTFHKYGRSLPLMRSKHPSYDAKMAISQPPTAKQ